MHVLTSTTAAVELLDVFYVFSGQQPSLSQVIQIYLSISWCDGGTSAIVLAEGIGTIMHDGVIVVGDVVSCGVAGTHKTKLILVVCSSGSINS